MEEVDIKKSIKNLKEYIEQDCVYRLYQHHPNTKFDDFEKYCIEHCTDIQTILTEQEQLEKENESLVAQYEWQGAIMVNEYMPLETIKKLFIPKSVIREKIEELEQNKNMNIMARSSQIDILKELLGEEK